MRYTGVAAHSFPDLATDGPHAPCLGLTSFTDTSTNTDTAPHIHRTQHPTYTGTMARASNDIQQKGMHRRHGRAEIARGEGASSCVCEFVCAEGWNGAHEAEGRALLSTGPQGKGKRHESNGRQHRGLVEEVAALAMRPPFQGNDTRRACSRAPASRAS